MDIDLEELAAIIEQLDKTEFTDFRYEKGDLRIAVRRGGHFPEETSPAAAPAPPPAAAGQGLTQPVAPAAQASNKQEPAAQAPTRQEPAAEVPAANPGGEPAAEPAITTQSDANQSPAASGTDPGLDPSSLPAGHVLVTAPMLGTFYRAPKPGEGPFVEIGDRVEAETVVCIMEVMKLMTSVPADAAGSIAAVFATDGELIEHGQPLFAIRQDA